MLKLADMTFRVSLAYPESESAAAAADCPGAPPVPEAAGTGADPLADTAAAPIPRWAVRCPVCGTEHPVAGPADRIDRCSFCSDPFDQRRIARATARPADQP